MSTLFIKDKILTETILHHVGIGCCKYVQQSALSVAQSQIDVLQQQLTQWKAL